MATLRVRSTIDSMDIDQIFRVKEKKKLLVEVKKDIP